MKSFSLIVGIFAMIQIISCLPVDKRFYQPSSAMFSMIAVHKGAQFKYHLVKFDGMDLKLVADDMAFFGRIKASNGYVLNIPSISTGNQTNATVPSTTNVLVDEEYRLTTTTIPANASEHFGISKSLLTYQGSNSFLACPDYSFNGEYSIFYNNDGKVECPYNATGYDITLMVQLDSTINYNNNTNINNVTISEL